MKRRRNHVGPLRRWLRFVALLDGRHDFALSQGWSDRLRARLRHRVRAVRARSAVASLNQVGGPQTQGN